MIDYYNIYSLAAYFKIDIKKKSWFDKKTNNAIPLQQPCSLKISPIMTYKALQRNIRHTIKPNTALPQNPIIPSPDFHFNWNYELNAFKSRIKTIHLSPSVQTDVKVPASII